ncbi:MAG TPA: polysaccharide biosynthesis/export family protein [Pyrinomonadaceae bacterium]
MKIKHSLTTAALGLALLTASAPTLNAQTAPQEEKEKRGGVVGAIFGQDSKAKKDAQKKNAPPKSSTGAPDRLEPDDTSNLASDVPAEIQAGRREQQSEEEAAVLPYYNNFLSSYRLGPEDVISIVVFGQDRYSKSGIVVPPDGIVSYYLIPEGIHVVGKTTRQLEKELTKRLDEYIIDPKITVSLDKAVSATYSVVGDVAQPGVRTMTRRYSITDALAMAGGVLNTGDKSKVVILRQRGDGTFHPIPVNVKEIERGRAKEMAFLVPGDQVIVPGNRFKKIKQWTEVLSFVSFARIFTGGW